MDGKRRQQQGLGIQARLAPLFNVIDRSSSSSHQSNSGDKSSDNNNGGGGGGRGGRSTSKGKDDGGSSSLSSSSLGFGLGGGGGGGGGGGLGPQLAGEKIALNGRVVSVLKQLGEGGFSFVYLVKDEADKNLASPTNKSQGRPSGVIRSSSSHSPSDSSSSSHQNHNNTHMVLKITSIHSRDQREIAEKEATLLQRLRHPSIVKIFDCCYRSPPLSSNYYSSSYTTASSLVSNLSRATGIPLTRNSINNNDPSPPHSSSQTSSPYPPHPRPQHLILMEYCEGGHALATMQHMMSQNERYSLPGLIIAFGQICNAVSYMHAQKPPIVHRDLKLNNFLLQRGAYKLCDFGSAIFGEVMLDSVEKKREAEDVILKTTTQMFRAPEMVDLYMSDRLTQSTDVWALGCCLYSMAFFQNCFEEGSNLAILSKNVKIPEQHPYGDGLVELIDRMLTVNHEERADMTEVILCLSALYSGKPLPARTKGKAGASSSKHTSNQNRDDRDGHSTGSTGGDGREKANHHQFAKNNRSGESSQKVGSFRTDGQGIHYDDHTSPKKPVEAKKLNPNSAAARRRAGRGRSSNNNSESSSSIKKNGKNNNNSSRNHSSDSSSRRHFNSSKGNVTNDQMRQHQQQQQQQESRSSMRISQSTGADDGFEATFVDSFSSFRDAGNGDNSFSTMDNPFSSSSNNCGDDKSTISNDNFLSFVGFDDAIVPPQSSSTPSPTISKNYNNNDCPFASADALSFSAISAPTTTERDGGSGRGGAPKASADGTTTATKRINNSDFNKMAPFDSNVTFPGLFDRFSSKKQKDSSPLTDLFEAVQPPQSQHQIDDQSQKMNAISSSHMTSSSSYAETSSQTNKRPLTIITNPNTTIPHKKETTTNDHKDNSRRTSSSLSPSFEHHLFPPPPTIKMSSSTGSFHTTTSEEENDNNDRYSTTQEQQQQQKCQLQTSTTF